MHARGIAVLAAIAGFVAPASAQATVTSSGVDSVVVNGSTTNYTTLLSGVSLGSPGLAQFPNDPGAPPSVSVSGHATAAGGDKVDLLCYGNGSTRRLAAGVPVTGGTFGTASVSAAPCLDKGPLILRAVPANTTPFDTAPFAGWVLAWGAVDYSNAANQISSGPNAGTHYDYYASAATPGTLAGADSPGRCGVFGQAYSGPNLTTTGAETLSCFAALYGDSGGGDPEIVVSGHRALDSYAQYQVTSPSDAGAGHFCSSNPLYCGKVAGESNLQFTEAYAPASGALTTESVDQLVLCINGGQIDDSLGGDPAAHPRCDSFTPAGASLDRKLTTSQGGAVITLQDQLASLTATALTAQLSYDYVTANASSQGSTLYSVGGAPFQTHVADDMLAGFTTAPATITVLNNNQLPDGDVNNQAAGIVFANVPDTLIWTGSSEFLAQFHNLTIPASGSLTLSQTFTMGVNSAAATALANQVADQSATPAVTIVAPANGSRVATPSVVVSGIASDRFGPVTMSVNGAAVAVSNTGWSTSVALAPGVNAITAVATNGAGRTASAATQVTFTPPAPAVPCKVPNLKNKTLGQARSLLLAAHCALGKVHSVKRHTRTRAGRIYAQSARPGVGLGAGAAVNVDAVKPAPRPTHKTRTPKKPRTPKKR